MIAINGIKIGGSLAVFDYWDNCISIALTDAFKRQP